MEESEVGEVLRSKQTLFETAHGHMTVLPCQELTLLRLPVLPRQEPIAYIRKHQRSKWDLTITYATLNSYTE